mgnify:CR=1 FL=1
MKSNEFNQVELPNGKFAIDLSPNNDRQLALVDAKVLERLVNLLPTAPFGDIKENLIDNIDQTTTIGEYLEVLEEEIASHKTVNLITELKRVENKVEYV